MVVTVNLHNQGPRTVRLDKRGQGFMRDDKRMRVCKEVERVGNKIIKIRSQNDAELAPRQSDERGQGGIAETWVGP